MVLQESAALLGIRIGTVQFQGKKSKVNQLTIGTPQGSSLRPTLFNMVINQHLQVDIASTVQMIAYINDPAIHGGPVGDVLLYYQKRLYGIEATTRTGI